MNYVDLVLFQCKLVAFRPALLWRGRESEVVTYQNLGRMIVAAERSARSAGIKPGHIVALFIRDAVLNLALTFGLVRMGAIVVSLPEPTLPASIHTDFYLSDVDQREAKDDLKVCPVDRSWMSGGQGLPDTEAIGGDDDYCRLLMTSGTTGYPKAIPLSHRQVIGRAMRCNTIYGHDFSMCSRVFLDMGFATNLGVVIPLYLLSKGGTLLLRGGNAQSLFQALETHDIEAMISTPNGFSNMLAACDQIKLEPRRFKAVISTGSMLPEAVACDVQRRFRAQLVSSYGSTECGPLATGPGWMVSGTDGSVGYVVPGAKIEVVDDAGQLLPPGSVGRLRQKNQFMADGYFTGHLDKLESFSGWCTSSDLGAVTPDGKLLISGRQEDVINLGGEKVAPTRIENAIMNFSAVSDVGVFAVQNKVGIPRIAAAVVWKANEDITAARQNLEKYLGKNLPASLVPSLFVELPSIPRNSAGKIDRVSIVKRAAEALLTAEK